MWKEAETLEEKMCGGLRLQRGQDWREVYNNRQV